MAKVYPNEPVIPVTARSTASIEAAANDALEILFSGLLGTAQPVDLLRLVDYELPARGIHFMPVNDDELPGWAIAQDFGDEGDDTEVLISETEWDLLIAAGRRAHHARGTIAHELGHVVLQHIEQRRKYRRLTNGGLQRAMSVEPYRDPEWQAWCFAGCFLAPRASIAAARTTSVTALAEIFQTSVDLMKHHCRRLKIRVY